MDKNTEETLNITAEELLKLFKENKDIAKKKYNKKIITIKGCITKTELHLGIIVLNKSILCKINPQAENKSLKQLFSDSELRYAVKGNKNISVRGEVSLGFGVSIKDCDVFYEGENPLVQDVDIAYQKASKQVKYSNICAFASIGLSLISLLLLFLEPTFAVPLILCAPVIGIKAYNLTGNKFFNRSISANSLASEAKDLNIPAHLGTGLRFFEGKLVATENYKISISRENWKNVELDNNTKKYISKDCLLGGSLLGIIFQASLFIPYIILSFIFYFLLVDFLPDQREDIIFTLSGAYGSIVYIFLDSPLILKRNSLFLKYAKQVAENQKKWTK